MDQPQPPQYPEIHDQETLALLMEHMPNLEYRLNGRSYLLKHPQLQQRFSGDPTASYQMNRRLCEAIMQLLEKHDRLKKKRPRKKAAADG